MAEQDKPQRPPANPLALRLLGEVMERQGRKLGDLGRVRAGRKAQRDAAEAARLQGRSSRKPR
jgi:hypothetical protein